MKDSFAVLLIHLELRGGHGSHGNMSDCHIKVQKFYQAILRYESYHHSKIGFGKPFHFNTLSFLIQGQFLPITYGLLIPFLLEFLFLYSICCNLEFFFAFDLSRH